MNEEAIRRSMLDSSDAFLLAVATGAAEGYTITAQLVAERILMERGVALPPDLMAQRQLAAAREAANERARAGLEQAEWNNTKKAWGVWLMILGLGSFVLPFFGYQFRLLMHLGVVLPVAAVALIVIGLILIASSSTRTHASTGTPVSDQ